jgi:hypothetical protein
MREGTGVQCGKGPEYNAGRDRSVLGMYYSSTEYIWIAWLTGAQTVPDAAKLLVLGPSLESGSI